MTMVSTWMLVYLTAYASYGETYKVVPIKPFPTKAACESMAAVRSEQAKGKFVFSCVAQNAVIFDKEPAR